jgi:hypothetical protein
MALQHIPKAMIQMVLLFMVRTQLPTTLTHSRYLPLLFQLYHRHWLQVVSKSPPKYN